MKSYKKHPYWKCDDNSSNDHMDDCQMDMHCPPPKMPCPPTKELVKTFKCCYKLYRMCTYCLCKICPICGHEFDFHQHRGNCPRCM